MKRAFLLLLIFSLAAFAGCSVQAGPNPPAAPKIINSRLPLVDFKAWPQVNFKGVRILLAENGRLASQGFAGARPADFERTLILFPSLPAGVSFTNRDQGYGPVVRDLRIAYFDRSGRLLKTDLMRRIDGVSTPPPGTVVAIEGLP